MSDPRRTLKWLTLGAAVTLCSASVWLAVLPPPHPRIQMNQMRAAQSMRQLNKAEQSHAANHPRHEFACDLHELTGLSSASEPQIDTVLAGGEKSGYRFTLSNGSSSPANNRNGYQAYAFPISQQLGTIAFCINEQGVLWYSRSSSASDCFEQKVNWPD